MTSSEDEFIDLCKKQVEQKFLVGSGGSYGQRELESLCLQIEQRTGVIISLSTMKRLWKGRYKQSPQPATLNALAVLLDYKDWQEFKLANKANIKAKSRLSPVLFTFFALLVVGSVIFWVARASNNPDFINTRKPLKINGPVNFEIESTVTYGVPNTVIFNYDLSKVVADSFFIQQSWNPDHRVQINPADRVITSIYYESGFHKAKLVANDSIIAIRPLHILSNGWEPHIYRHDSDPEIIDLKKESFVGAGFLHIDSGLLAKRNVDFSQRFHTRITNSRRFNVHSDNFTFSTRMKVDYVFEQVCPWMDLVIVTDVSSFNVSWTGKGCETKASYKLGEILRSGKNNNLSDLGRNIYEWQDLEIKVKDRHAVIYLNGKPTYEATYKEDFGNIVALIYIFDGTGSIDFAKLNDNDGQIVFEDNFDNFKK